MKKLKKVPTNRVRGNPAPSQRYVVVQATLRGHAQKLVDLAKATTGHNAAFIYLRFEGNREAEDFLREIAKYEMMCHDVYPKRLFGWPEEVARERLTAGLKGIPIPASPMSKFRSWRIDNDAPAGVEWNGETVVIARELFCPAELLEIVEDLAMTRRQDLPVRESLFGLVEQFISVYRLRPPVRVHSFVLIVENAESVVATSDELETITADLHDLHERLLCIMTEIVRIAQPCAPHHVLISLDSRNDPLVEVDGRRIFLQDRPLKALLALALLRDEEVFPAAAFAKLYSGKELARDAKAAKDTFSRPVGELKKALPRLQVDPDEAVKRAGRRRVWGLQCTLRCSPGDLEKWLMKENGEGVKNTILPSRSR